MIILLWGIFFPILVVYPIESQAMICTTEFEKNGQTKESEVIPKKTKNVLSFIFRPLYIVVVTTDSHPTEHISSSVKAYSKDNTQQKNNKEWNN